MADSAHITRRNYSAPLRRRVAARINGRRISGHVHMARLPRPRLRDVALSIFVSWLLAELCMIEPRTGSPEDSAGSSPLTPSGG